MKVIPPGIDKPILDKHGTPIEPYWYRDGLRVMELGTDDVIATCHSEEQATMVADINNVCWRYRRALKKLDGLGISERKTAGLYDRPGQVAIADLDQVLEAINGTD